jgi:transcriptional regulator with XRE-family HTH domain
MAEQRKNRTVTPDGQAIQRMRIEKGWRVEDLARKAGCSLKTVENVERGANVYLFTLSRSAQALHVEVATLMTGTAPAPLPTKERTWEITIKVSPPFDEFDESTDLIQFMKTLIKRLGDDDMEPGGIRSGSVRIRIKLTSTQIMRLIDAYKEGRLDDMEIESISAPVSFVDTSRSQQRIGTKELWVRNFPDLVKEFQKLRRKEKKPETY